MGVTLLMIAGHFDLSVGSVLGFSSVIGPYLILNYGTSPLVAVLASVGVAISIGLVNGVLVVGTRIPSFIVTLGTLLIWKPPPRLTEGFPVAVDKDHSSTRSSRTGSRTASSAGTRCLSSGSSASSSSRSCSCEPASGTGSSPRAGTRRAARSMGVPVVWIILFVVTALCACLAGLIQVGRFNTVEATRADARAHGDRGCGRRRRPPERRLRIGAGRRARCGDDRDDPAGARALGIASYWLQFAVGVLIILAADPQPALGRTRPQI